MHSVLDVLPVYTCMIVGSGVALYLIVPLSMSVFSHIYSSFIAYVSCLRLCLFYVFFFKKKTAYEMRISDWSSDVCSSDLRARDRRLPHPDDQRGGARDRRDARRLCRRRSRADPHRGGRDGGAGARRIAGAACDVERADHRRGEPAAGLVRRAAGGSGASFAQARGEIGRAHV